MNNGDAFIFTLRDAIQLVNERICHKNVTVLTECEQKVQVEELHAFNNLAQNWKKYVGKYRKRKW